MGLFDNGSISPQGQGLLALSQALLQAGRPSPYKLNTGAALAQGLNAFTPAYQQGMDQQNLKAATSAATPQGMMASLAKINSPEIQNEILKSRMSMMPPKYEITKDAYGNPIAVNPLNPSDSKPVGGSANGAPTGGFTDNELKAYQDGRLPISSRMVSTPRGQALLNALTEKDPTFDAVNYNARAKTRADYTSGKTAQNIKSIETALNTLSQAQDASDKVGGVNNAWIANTPLNWAYSKYLGAESSPELNTYNTLAKTAADETTRAVIGAGGTGADRETRESQFGVAQSPDARKASLTTAAQELAARLDPIANGYNQGMGTTKGGIDLLSPQAQNAYYKLTGQMPANATAGQAQPQQPATQPQQPTMKLSQQQAGNAVLQAKSAIAKGAPRDAVIKRLQSAGVNTSNLGF